MIGAQAAIGADWALWTAGTVAGLITAVGVPYLMIVRHRVPAGSAAPSWLLPIVGTAGRAATCPVADGDACRPGAGRGRHPSEGVEWLQQGRVHA